MYTLFKIAAVLEITPFKFIERTEEHYALLMFNVDINIINRTFIKPEVLFGFIVFKKQIGKGLRLSFPFPPVHTVRATFTVYGVPTNPIHSILCTQVKLV